MQTTTSRKSYIGFCRINVSVDYKERNFTSQFLYIKEKDERVLYADSERSGSRVIYYFRFHILLPTSLAVNLGLAISVFAFGRRGLEEFFLWT